MTEDSAIRVVFLDAASGREIGRGDLPVEQLPDSFEDRSTTLELAGSTWSVEAADPLTSAAFRTSGKLTLLLRRLLTADPHEVLYSLPTICDVVPTLGDAPAGRSLHLLHEDDWRQVEFVDATLAPVIDEQFRAVRLIFTDHSRRADDGRLIGFDAVHLRTQPADPLPRRPPLPALLELLPAVGGQVGFVGEQGAVPGSFAVPLGTLVLYGLAPDDEVVALCLDPVPGSPAEAATQPAPVLRPVMEAFDLLLVDWCRTAVIDADGIETGLAHLLR